jgi:periplasmic divalent cation tolerance protein
MKENEFISVYITYKNEAEAEMICKELLDKKCIACANLYPVKSMYHWEGKIEKESEYVSELKTHTGKWEEILKIVHAMHSYEVPCIVKKKFEASDGYGTWVKESLVKM